MKSFFKSYPKYKWALAITDFFLLLLSFTVTFLVVWKVKFLSQFTEITERQFSESFVVITTYCFLCLIYFQYAGFYKIHNIIKPANHFFLILKTLLMVVFGFILFQFLIKNVFISSRVFYLCELVVSTILFSIVRIPFLKLLSSKKLLTDRVVILGAGKKGKALLEVFAHKIKLYDAVGFLDDNEGIYELDGIPVLGSLEDAPQIAEKYDVDYFILAIDKIEREKFFEIFAFFQKKKLGFYVSSDYLNVLYDNLDVDTCDEFGLIRFPSLKNDKLFQYMKRAFDIVLCSIGIILLSPVFLFLTIAIKLSSPGPIIYSQIRIGKNGQPFNFYKFRSMYVGSDKDMDRQKAVADFIKGGKLEDGTTKIVNKSKVTPIGNILRKYSLDELPQFFNVLKGDMSLVGPRPCLLSEWEVYEDWQKLRLESTPGCTGVWQVSGRSKVGFEETVLMDIFYNKNYSPWLDLQILFKTVPVMVLGKGGG